jgi:hypothetical protein
LSSVKELTVALALAWPLRSYVPPGTIEAAQQLVFPSGPHVLVKPAHEAGTPFVVESPPAPALAVPPEPAVARAPALPPLPALPSLCAPAAPELALDSPAAPASPSFAAPPSTLLVLPRLTVPSPARAEEAPPAPPSAR